MTDTFNFREVQLAIGYSFKDAALLKEAFTDSSCKSENKTNTELAVIGKKLTDFLISDFVHSRSVGEGTFEERVITFSKTLAPGDFIKNNKLQKFILMSGGDGENNTLDETVCTEVFYALAAAIYRNGGLPSVKSVLMPFMKAAEPQKDKRDRTPARRNNFNRISMQKLPDSGAEISDLRKSRGILDILRPKKNKVEENKATSEEPKARFAKEKSLRVSSINELESYADSEKTESVERGKSPFIRDALQPVRLKDVSGYRKTRAGALGNAKTEVRPDTFESARSDSQTNVFENASYKSTSGNFGSTKSEVKPNSLERSKTENSTKTAAETAVARRGRISQKTESAEILSDGINYKSKLQEYIQKHLRSSNVLIEYKDISSGGGYYECEVYFNDRLISKSGSENKKDASKYAAKAAYEQIQDPASELGKWFRSIDKKTVSRQSDSTETDYVSLLNQFYQKKERTSAVSLRYEKLPSENRRQIKIAVISEDKSIAEGAGASVKEAKQNAAKNALEVLK